MKKQVVFACDIGGSKLLCCFLDEDGDIIDTEKALLPPNVSFCFGFMIGFLGAL